MTIGIGLLCEDKENNREAMVLCTDSRLTHPTLTSDVTTDLTFKFEVVSPNGFMAISGPLTEARELAQYYRAHLVEIAVTTDNLYEAIKTPAVRYKQKLIDRMYESTHGINAREFYCEVYPKLTTKQQAQYRHEAAAVSSGCWSLISIFVEDRAHLFHVNDDGSVYESDDFGVIGSGVDLAKSILIARGYSSTFSLSRALYAAYEAKRFSEQNPYVGGGTVMCVHHQGDIPMPISKQGIELLEGLRCGFWLREIHDWPVKAGIFEPSLIKTESGRINGEVSQ